MMSSKAKYAIRAALVLAERQASGGWTPTAIVAEDGDIPRKFLETILAELRNGGFVVSRRGPGGGHQLARDAGLIMAGEIIRIVEGQLAMTPCSSRRHFRACADCVDVRSCRLRHVMLSARDAVAGVLDRCSLAEMSQSVQADAVAASMPTGRRAIKTS